MALTAGLTGAAAAWVVGLPWWTGPIAGRIVSSTDAAAVFSILRTQNIGLDERHSATLELESGANDPMAVFLTIAFIQIVLAETSSWTDLGLQFLIPVAVGAMAGLLAGRFGAWLINNIHLDAPGLYPVLAFIIGLIAFGSAALLDRQDHRVR